MLNEYKYRKTQSLCCLHRFPSGIATQEAFICICLNSCSFVSHEFWMPEALNLNMKRFGFPQIVVLMNPFFFFLISDGFGEGCSVKVGEGFGEG